MRPHPRRARTDATSPRAWSTSDRTGFIGNHEDQQWQFDWAGFKLRNKHILVNPDELDVPQRQLGAIIIPPDPLPIINARPENYMIDEETYRVTEDGQVRYTMNGVARVQSNVQSGET